MRVKILPRAKKEFKKLRKVDQIAVAEKIGLLVDDKVEEKKLRGYKRVYRVRVGSIRIVYKRTSQIVYIILIGDRKDIYRALKRLMG